MREVFDNSGQDCGINNESQDGYFSEIPGWETEIESNEIIRYSLIDHVNKTVSLEELFSRFYYIDFEETYSPSGWTHKSCCPFPDHDDDTPSFGYNPRENRFFCFGCSRGGKAVQFVSLMDKITLADAANKIINLLDIKYKNIEVCNNGTKEVDELLLSTSNRIRNFIKLNNGSLKFAEDLMWVIDIYLHKHVPRSTIDLSNLKARVNIILKKIESYEQNANNR